MGWLRRCTVITKEQVGVVHLHTGLLRRNAIKEVLFTPEGRGAVYTVPEPAWQSMLEAGTWEQAMALVRDVPASHRNPQ